MQEIDEDRDEFISKNNITFKPNQYGSNLKLDKQVNDESALVRIAMVKQGYGLDKLVNDTERMVRQEVAKLGYGLDRLINDENRDVREEVANYLNNKAYDDFIIDLGNKLLDNGYKLNTNDLSAIFIDKDCTKFRQFDCYKNEIIAQVLVRLLWKNIRVKEMYDPNYPLIMRLYLRRRGLLKEKK
jgi:hypothetical protein